MSASSDSDDYSSRVLSQKNKTNDENFMSCKNNFIKDFQNRSNMASVAHQSFHNANGSFVSESEKRKRENPDEPENVINSSRKHKKNKVHDANEEVENGPDEFVTIRDVAKKKSKKKNRSFDADELDDHEKGEGKKKHKKKKHQSLSEELYNLDVEAGDKEQEEQELARKKNKKSKNQIEHKMENSTNETSLHLNFSTCHDGEKVKKTKKNSIITSTQEDRSAFPVKDLTELDQSLLDFEEKNLSIQNIGNEVAEEELDIDKLLLIEEAKFQLQSNKKTKTKVRVDSENSTKPKKRDILKTFEKSNSSLKKVNYCENDSLHNVRDNSSCFIVQVPVGLDPSQLIGSKIALKKENKIAINDNEYVASPRKSEVSLIVLGENNQNLRLNVSSVVTMNNNSEAEIHSNEQNDMINDLITKQVNSLKSPNKRKPQKNKVEQLDTFLQEGLKFLEDVKYVSFRFKNEKFLADLDQETNLLLRKQMEFLQEENASSAGHKKMAKELAVQTRELLQKRMNVMKSKKVGSDGELSDYF